MKQSDNNYSAIKMRKIKNVFYSILFPLSVVSCHHAFVPPAYGR
jgi:hypothetical protein